MSTGDCQTFADQGTMGNSPRKFTSCTVPAQRSELVTRAHEICKAWQHLLGVSSIALDDNVFELGADSLLANRFVAEWFKATAVDIPVVKLFEFPTSYKLATHLSQGQVGVPLHEKIRERVRQSRAKMPGFHQDMAKVAVVGMAGRFPGARDLDQLWRNLCAGRESVTFFDKSEVDPSADTDDVQHPGYVCARGIMEDADRFDASFFGINPHEAAVMDPQQRVFLELAWQALENAAVAPESFDGLVGVYAGMGDNRYYEFNVSRNPELRKLVGELQVEIGREKDHIATLVSHKLNLTGPSVSVHTACSTGLVAVDMAYQSLVSHQCDLALAGAIEIRIPQKQGQIHEPGGIFTQDGHCRPFDAQATGTMFSDGAGIVVLKRLSDALADGDQIYAVILGSAVNHDGADKASYLAPSVRGQAEVIALAQARADVDPDSISYIETHGTGTPVGDPIEVEALTAVFRTQTQRMQYCALGSIKSNLGHPTTSAGIAGFIKAVLCLHHKTIPPTINYKNPNPRIDFDTSPFYVNTELAPWQSGSTPRRAAVSSFGFCGTNAHVIVEEAPSTPSSQRSTTATILLLSAKTMSSLDSTRASLEARLAEDSTINLDDVAYTLATGRTHFDNRRFVVASNALEAIAALEKQSTPSGGPRHVDVKNPEVVFVFPGQGSQHPNMGRGLYEREPVYRTEFDRCAVLFRKHLGFDLRKIVFAEKAEPGHPERDLKHTLVAQPVIFSMEWALAALWRSWGIVPSAMVGHSVGEFACACIGGVFGLEDATRLIAARSRLMSDLPSGSMLSVRMAPEDIRPLMTDDLAIAAINAPSLCVVSGPDAQIDPLAEVLSEKGIRCKKLETSHAFHSSMMDPVVESFAQFTRKVELSPSSVPIVSTVAGTWMRPEQAQDPMYWARHLRQTVRFSDAIAQVWQDPSRVLLEVGPGNSSSVCAKQIARDTRVQHAVPSLGPDAPSDDDSARMAFALCRLWLVGVTPDWKGYFARQTRRKMPLPTYAFERKRFWVEPLWTHAKGIESMLGTGAFGNDSAEGPALERTEGTRPPRESSEVVKDLVKMVADVSGMDVERIHQDASFFELGLDSLSLTQVSFLVAKSFGVRFTLRQLTSEVNTIDALAASIRGSAEPNMQATPLPAQGEHAEKVASEQVVPSTDAQREIWVSCSMGQEASLAYIESLSITLRGEVDRIAVEEAIFGIVARHDALRSRFEDHGRAMVISSADAVRPEIRWRDLSQVAEGQRRVELQAMTDKEVTLPFDLTRAPLLRATIVRLTETEHVVVLSSHHIVCDGWSLDVLIKDLSVLYASLAKGLEAPKFSDYAKGQEAYATTQAYDRDERYWLEQFATDVPPLELPLDGTRPARRSYRGGYEAITLGASTFEAIKRVSVRHQCSLFCILLAAYQIYLARVSNQTDVVVGVPAAGQPREDQSDLVGHCANLLPIRVTVDPRASFAAYIEKLKGTLLDVFDRQRYTYGRLVQRLNPPREPSRMPLMSVGFTHTKRYRREQLGFEGLEVSYELNPRRFEAFEIYMNASESADALRLKCQYNSDLFTSTSIRRHLEQMVTLIDGLVANTSAELFSAPVVSAAGESVMIRSWNQTQASVPEVCIHEWFDTTATRFSEIVAATDGQASWTYGTLKERANAMAAKLVAVGVKKNALVGVMMNRSLEMLSAVLGILKAGGAYVPLDPSYPSARLRFMIEDAGLSVVVKDGDFDVDLRGVACVIDIRPDRQEVLPSPTSAPRRASGPDDLAYVIYTSGSTGTPKGVQVAHRSVVNFLESMRLSPGMTDGDTVLAVTTLSFDISVLELLLPLVVGAKVVLASRQDALDGARLRALLQSHNVTLMQATPSTFRILLAAGWHGASGLKVLCGGEPLSKEMASQLVSRCSELWNMYGPTETTVWSTCGRVTVPVRKVHVGKPILNTQIYVLNASKTPQPIGVTGDVWIAGQGLSTGYLHRPELTLERFVANPFNRSEGAFMYQTGDLGRWDADGQLEILGRNDRQVKHRGHRIELEEIEACLLKAEGIDSVVVAIRGTPQDARLIAYVVCRPEATCEPERLRNHLRASLPEYMIPQHFVPIVEIPTLPNGKADYESLPLPGGGSGEQPKGIAPMTPLERALTELWEETLEVAKIGPDDDFFHLGGHSLLASVLVSRINRQLHTLLGVIHLYEAPTVRKLALHIETQAEGNRTQAERPLWQDDPTLVQHASLSQNQHLVWFLERLGTRTTSLSNLLMEGFMIQGQLDIGVLERSLGEVIRRHSVLRTRFDVIENNVVQTVGEPFIYPLVPADLTSAPETERDRRLRELIDDDAHAKIDVSSAPLFRIRLYRLSSERHAITFVFHHIIWDGQSFPVFYHELWTQYEAYRRGQFEALSPPKIQYADYATWYDAWLKDDKQTKKIDYWRTKLKGTFNRVDLPSDRPHPGTKSNEGSTVVFSISDDHVRKMEAIGLSRGATLFMVLLSVVTATVHRCTGNKDVAILSPTHSRTLPELEHVLGFFAQAIVIRTLVDESRGFSEVLDRVKNSCIEAYRNQDVSLGKALARVRVRRPDGTKTNVSRILPVIFTYQDRSSQRTWVDGLSMARLPMRNRTTQSDVHIWLKKHSDGIEAGIDYRTDIFLESTVETKLVEPFLEYVNRIVRGAW